MSSSSRIAELVRSLAGLINLPAAEKESISKVWKMCEDLCEVANMRMEQFARAAKEAKAAERALLEYFALDESDTNVSDVLETLRILIREVLHAADEGKATDVSAVGDDGGQEEWIEGGE